jgi:hypothetical protein
MYTDSTNLFNSTLDKQVIFELMKFEQVSSQTTSTFKYIIEPTSLAAQIIRDMSVHSLRKRNKPRIRINSSLKQFQLNLDPQQIKHVSSTIKLINIYNNKQKCLSLLNRPTSLSSITIKDVEPVDHNDQLAERKRLLKSWWLYSIQCVRLNLQKPNMNDLIKWSIDVNLYKKIYEQILKNRFTRDLHTTSVDDQSASQQQHQVQTASNRPAESSDTPVVEVLAQTVDPVHSLPVHLFNEKQRIEAQWSLQQLSLIRRLVFENFFKHPIFKDYLIRLKATSSQPETVNENLGVYGYLSWRLTNFKDYYFGGNAKQPLQPQQSEISESAVHNQVDDEVLALISDSIENDSLLRRDSLLAYLEFKLESASIIISDMNSIQIAEFKFERSKFLLEALPRHDSYLFQINLGSFYLYDCVAIKRNNAELQER